MPRKPLTSGRGLMYLRRPRDTIAASQLCTTERSAVRMEQQMRQAKHAVVIVGGGPTGLMLADELAVPIERGREVTGFAQDDTGVDVELSDSSSLRAEYLVGCDGGRSLIRKAAGIDFPGWDPTISHLIAEVQLAEEPKWGLRRDALGINSLSRPEGGGPVRVLVTE